MVLERKGGFREKTVRFSGSPRPSGEGSGERERDVYLNMSAGTLTDRTGCPRQNGKKRLWTRQPRPDKGFRA
ncbi:hypothetical protein B4135_4179 [Caldibacillus debilis]|uniref:Uncharacterized protein n=1 Tax=Caldibacillus debilis TaxID=301148 RepID=A0A150L6S1_9BACI|nr:hypothetical protein B4135_4179 [Caldibacillus debilis]